MQTPATLGLNHLTIPTMLVNFAYCCVAVSLILSCVHRYAPSVLAQRALHCAKFPAHTSLFICVLLRCCFIRPRLRTRYVPFSTHSTPCTAGNFPAHTSLFILCRLHTLQKRVGDLETGSNPSTSSVTGWHSNQLNYQAANGGSYRARTYDPLLVRQMLSQLS